MVFPLIPNHSTYFFGYSLSAPSTFSPRESFCHSTHLWEWHDKVMQLSLLWSFYDFFHGNVFGVVPILDIVCYATGKQHWFLGDNSNVGTKKLDIYLFAVMPIYHLPTEGTTRALSFRIPAARKVYIVELILCRTFALLKRQQSQDS